jgi:hypothetical protein
MSRVPSWDAHTQAGNWGGAWRKCVNGSRCGGRGHGAGVRRVHNGGHGKVRNCVLDSVCVGSENKTVLDSVCVGGQ